MIRLAVLGAALGCFSSFGWAMRRHFQHGSRCTAGTRMVGLMGTMFAITQVASIATSPSVLPFAFIPYGVALALFWWAVRSTRGKHFAACFRGVTNSIVLATGPYAYIRHPFYMSYLIAWMGAFAATLNWMLLVPAVVMGAFYISAAINEERGFLAGPLSSEYRRYRSRTAGFLSGF